MLWLARGPVRAGLWKSSPVSGMEGGRLFDEYGNGLI